MAKSYVFLIAIFLIVVSLSSPSQGLTIAGYTINRVIIDDVLYCNVTGERSTISNATVYLTRLNHNPFSNIYRYKRCI
ncbi:unnamed protein product [Brassica oleracea]